MDILLMIVVIAVLLAVIGIVFSITAEVMEIPNVIRFKKKDKTEQSGPKAIFGAILRSNLHTSDKDIGIIKDGEIVYPKKTDIYTQVDEIRNVVSVNVKCEFDYDEVFDLMRKRKDGV